MSNIPARIAVIDTETNWDNELMSVAAVTAEDGAFLPLEARYFVIGQAYERGGMFSREVLLNPEYARWTGRAEAVAALREFLLENGVQKVFAYNARFDYALLPELSRFTWHDIMTVAVNRNFNKAIPETADCYKTGRLKHGCGVQPILRIVSGDPFYRETHNALNDALDELAIMRGVGVGADGYAAAVINCGRQKR